MNWWLDALLYIGFMAAFFLDLTGVEIHQWLGLVIGALAFIHLARHMSWVSLVVSRFFGKTTNCARINLFIDSIIGAGFFSILSTGLLISTWFDLPFLDYTTWITIHTLASVLTLFAVVIKLALHRKWIVNVAEKYIFGRGASNSTLSDTQAPVAVCMNRREFLKMGAFLGAGTVVGIAQLHNVMEDILFSQVDGGNAVSNSDVSSAVDAGVVFQNQSGNTYENQSRVVLPTTQPTTVPTQIVTDNKPVTTCTVSCPRGCSYPGRCRRYVDTNGNGKCDNGECL